MERGITGITNFLFVLAWSIGSLVVQDATALVAHSSEARGPAGLLVRNRRTMLVESFAGVVGAIGLTAASPPAKASNDQNSGLLSIESAARLESFEGRLLSYPNPGLRKTAAPVQSFGTDLERVVDRLVDTMVGTATTPFQYGIDARIVILRGDASSDDDSTLVLVNPNVLARSTEDKMIVWREYCRTVSATSEEGKGYQRLEVDVLRDAVVEIAAQDYRTGRPIRKALSGEPARAFQHELDHLEGILVIDHADLNELPDWIGRLEAPYHRSRQQKAFARTIYSGNGPLYW